MLVSVIAAASFALITAADAPAAAQPTAADRAAAAAAAEAADRSTDHEIEQALWKLLNEDPDRVVCTEQVILGSRQPRAACGTVKRWFDARQPSEVARQKAPWQLVEQIKKGRKEALQKRRGG